MSYHLPLGEVTAHEVTDGCWIDGTVDTSLHDHHVIPQAAGGRDGPQVTICSDCHNAIHHAADLDLNVMEYIIRPDAKKKWRTVEALKRADYLIGVIKKAVALANESINKTVTVGAKLSADENDRLNYIAKRLGRSKVFALKWAIMNVKI